MFRLELLNKQWDMYRCLPKVKAFSRNRRKMKRRLDRLYNKLVKIRIEYSIVVEENGWDFIQRWLRVADFVGN